MQDNVLGETAAVAREANKTIPGAAIQPVLKTGGACAVVDNRFDYNAVARLEVFDRGADFDDQCRKLMSQRDGYGFPRNWMGRCWDQVWPSQILVQVLYPGENHHVRVRTPYLFRRFRSMQA